MGLHTKSVCRNCYATQSDPPGPQDYRLTGTLQCLHCGKFYCTPDSMCPPDTTANPSTTPFKLRTRGKFEADEAHASTLRGDPLKNFMQGRGYRTFEHACKGIPGADRYQPGARYIQDKMHIIDEGGTQLWGGGLVWYMVADGVVADVATIRQIDRAHPPPKHQLADKQLLYLQDSLSESTDVEVDGEFIKGPGKGCRLSGKAANIALWALYSIPRYQPLIDAHIGTGPEPAWWVAWKLYVEEVALVLSPGTNELWARQLAKAIQTHREAAWKIRPWRRIYQSKKPHYEHHLPAQGVGYGPIHLVTAYRFEAEHQPHKRSARDCNRHHTEMSIAMHWAASSAKATFCMELSRTEIIPMARAKHSEVHSAVTVAALADATERESLTQVLSLVKPLRAEDQIQIEWHEAVQFNKYRIALGGWVVTTCDGLKLDKRLGVVDSIFHANGQWCIYINIFPEWSLVELSSGQLVSQDPRVITTVESVAAPEQVRTILTSGLELFPVMKLPAPRQSKTRVYLVPE